MSTIQEELIDIIVSIAVCDRSTVTPEKSYSDLGIDSLDIMEVIFDVEEKFNISIDEEVENFYTYNFTTVEQTVRFIEDKLKEKA